ncbi:MAG: LPS export ABC transporter ATP-binding protein [Vampirovibrio sp.]|jgi:lipopolysaccharide export system ATP-binding protein
MMSLLVEHVYKSYGERSVVNDVSFKVNAGEAVGLLGPNGAGKTTSFYSIVGVIQPDAGQISIDQVPVQDLPIHERARLGLGYLPQESSIFRGLTVAENLDLVLEFQPYSPKEAVERRNALLAEFGILKLKDSAALKLSGGERRRLEIARALAANPKYLLLDEPFTGIDPITIEELQRLIAHLQERGLGILITDHNPKATLGIVSRAYVMFDGQVLFEGTNEEVAQSDLVRKSYLGEGFTI